MTWPTKKLGEVVELRYGKGISKYDRRLSGKYPVYGANGELGRTDKYLVEGEAIIVGRKGSAGEVTRVTGKFWPADVTYYVFGNKTIDIDFLFYFFKLFDLRRFAVGVKPGINRNRVYEIEIPLPSLEIQKKVVKKIEGLFAKISQAQSLRETVMQDTDNLIPATLSKIFEEGKLKGWKDKELSELCDLQNGFAFKSSDYIKDSNTLNIRMSNIRPSGIFDPNHNIRFLPDSYVDKYSSFLLNEGDLVIAMTDMATDPKILGIPTLVRNLNGRNFLLNQRVGKLFDFSPSIYIPFLKYYLSMQKVKEYYKDKGGGGLQINISKKDILSVQVPVPPIAEQRKIVEKMDALTQEVRELQQLQSETATNLTALKQSILHKAFQGELIN